MLGLACRNLATLCANMPDINRLHRLQNLLFEFPLHLLALLICRRLTVKIQERTEIEFGRLQQLDFPDVYLVRVSMNKKTACS